MTDEILYKYVRGKGWVIDHPPSPSEVRVTVFPEMLSPLALVPGTLCVDQRGTRYRVLEYNYTTGYATVILETITRLCED